MLKSIQLLILLCLTCNFGNFMSIFCKPLSPALAHGKKACFKEVAEMETVTEKEETALWENENTGFQLTKCVFKQTGALNSYGINMGMVKNAIHEERIRRLLPEVATLDESIDRCSQMTIYKTDVDQITRCIYHTVKQAYEQLKV